MVSIIALISIFFHLATYNISEVGYKEKATFQNMSQCEQAQVDDQICVPKTDSTVGLFDES